MPVAALGRIKVVSLDYRQGPQHRHPAASEDVAAAYREFLKTYRPREHRHLRLLGRRHADGDVRRVVPAARPAAAGRHRHSVLRAPRASTEGRSAATRLYHAAARRRPRACPPPERRPGNRRRWSISRERRYDDPLVAPARSPEVLAQVSAHADRDGHAVLRAQQRRVHARSARQARRRCRSARLGRHVSRLLLQPRRAGVARMLRRDREVLRSSISAEVAVTASSAALSGPGAQCWCAGPSGAADGSGNQLSSSATEAAAGRMAEAPEHSAVARRKASRRGLGRSAASRSLRTGHPSSCAM